MTRCSSAVSGAASVFTFSVLRVCHCMTGTMDCISIQEETTNTRNELTNAGSSDRVIQIALNTDLTPATLKSVNRHGSHQLLFIMISCVCGMRVEKNAHLRPEFSAPITVLAVYRIFSVTPRNTIIACVCGTDISSDLQCDH